MVPEPQGQTEPWLLTITAKPQSASADIDGLVCRVRVRQIDKPRRSDDTYGYLRADGEGRLTALISLRPYLADTMENYSPQLQITPYVSPCKFDPTTVTGTVKEPLDR